MTLDEAITKCLIGEEHLDQAEYEQVGEWLEELNKVKQELNKVSQEFEVYKKAYEIVCNRLGELETDCNCCPIGTGTTQCDMYDSVKKCGEIFQEYYLRKSTESLRNEE